MRKQSLQPVVRVQRAACRLDSWHTLRIPLRETWGLEAKNPLTPIVPAPGSGDLGHGPR